MNNKKKYIAVLSVSAIAAMLAGTNVKAADKDIYDNSTKKPVVEYNGGEGYIENFEQLREAVLDSVNYGYEFKGQIYNLETIGNRTANKSEKEFDAALDQIAKDTTVTRKDLEDFTGGAVEDKLVVESVSAITDSKLNIKLSTKVDEVSAKNFKIQGLTVNAATLSENKKEVKLDVRGAQVNKEYTIIATGLKINGKVMDDITYKFIMPSAESLFTPEVTMKDTVLKANGQTSTLVTFALKDSNGIVMKDAGKVEVAFTTTFGKLAEKRVTVQNGIATVLLTSETLDSAKSAKVRATVVDAVNTNLIGLESSKNILMDPNPKSDEDESIGATMTEVQAAQADRVIAYFNKDVTVEKYAKEGTYELDNKKATATVWKNVGNNGEVKDENKVTVVGILPVQGNSKALQLVLGTNTVLTDNSNFAVEFIDKTGTLDVERTKQSKLTDARKPAMLSVAREGLKTLKVTFSEPVNTKAENLANWIIDGIALKDDVYGASANPAKVTVEKFDETTGEDARNVVSIELGKDAKENQIYFKSGVHSIQGANIGDWANLSDEGNNVMNTQTLDFDIPVDTTAPTAKVEVQSPEQYIVTFDKELNESENKIKEAIKLEKYNKNTAEWEPETKQTINIEEIKNLDETKQYKVEVEKDWTDEKVYNTKDSTQNYYNDNYRLVIGKGEVSSTANGVKNAEIALPLEGAMKTPDVTSPVISEIVENLDANKKPNGTYTVTMSEPVKFPGGVETLAQGQDSIPTPIAQFIKKDGSKTIHAKVENGADAYDRDLVVTPVQKDETTKLDLEAGDWTIVVGSISDDIGNTAASATKDFTVEKGEAPKEDGFKVVWSFADKNGDLDSSDIKVTEDKDTDADYVYVKFNKSLSITGDAKNALKTSNYQLDGMSLPTGTQIKANIKGFDDADKVTDSITIVLPDGYLNGNEQPHVITISDYLESTTNGDILTNGGAKTLTWTADKTEVFEASFEAEKLVYAAEKAVKEDLKVEAKLNSAKKAIENAKTAVDDLDVKTSAKDALETRVKAVEKTVQNAKTQFEVKANLEKAKTAISTLESTVKNLAVEDDLTDAKNAVKTAEDALGKLPDGTKELTELTTRFNLANQKVEDTNSVKTAISNLVNNLVLDNVTNDLDLPVAQDGCEVSWKSDNTDILSNDGKITRPEVGEKDAMVTLHVTIKKGKIIDNTLECNVTIKAKEADA